MQKFNYQPVPQAVWWSEIFADDNISDYRLGDYFSVFLQMGSLDGATVCLGKIHTMMCD